MLSKCVSSIRRLSREVIQMDTFKYTRSTKHQITLYLHLTFTLECSRWPKEIEDSTQENAILLLQIAIALT